MPIQPKNARRGKKNSRSVFLSFEFERDAGRRGTFIGQAKNLCEFAIIDKSLPRAQHDTRWRREARERIGASHVVMVLLGPDTHTAPGVKDELSLAGEVRCPVVQLMPRGKNYGLVTKSGAVCQYKWSTINQMLQDPKAFAASAMNRNK
ncbi:MAG: hypothetical protein OXE87_13355 [Chloroflexi bacterium]|nr:hypothetical protein [Chloroflexota bacterium]